MLSYQLNRKPKLEIRLGILVYLWYLGNPVKTSSSFTYSNYNGCRYYEDNRYTLRYGQADTQNVMNFDLFPKNKI